MTNDLILESMEVGAHPIIGPFMKRLRLAEHFREALGRPDRRLKLDTAQCALLLVRNFALSRHPLYGVPEWLGRFDPTQLGISPQQAAFLNDDRLGRALDKMFSADLRSLMTRIVVHACREFRLDLSRLHNDSTSITFSGAYDKGPRAKNGRRRLKITHGHNKDHRPDLKQLVWALTVSEDGAVPVHYNVYDGNVTDDTTHIETWRALCGIVGEPDFIYVADSKLCTKSNMAYVHKNGGRFLTVLPRTRKEDARFKDWILHHTADWKTIWERPSPRRQSDPPERFEAIEGPEPTAEGYRLVWYRSTEKWKRDQQARDKAIQKARFEVQRLRERAGKRRLKTRDQVRAAAEKILDQTDTKAWLDVEIIPKSIHTHKQAGPGRPGHRTRYVRITHTVYEPFARIDEESVAASASADGVFPLVANIPVETMTPLDLLKTYKYQSFLEKRHEQLKTDAHVVPVNYKSPERIEAYLFLYFIALLIHALIERHVRRSMKTRKIRSIPLYYEHRECRAPTARKILDLFEPLRRHRLSRGERHVKIFWDPLTEVQRLVLDLLETSASEYGQ